MAAGHSISIICHIKFYFWSFAHLSLSLVVSYYSTFSFPVWQRSHPDTEGNVWLQGKMHKVLMNLHCKAISVSFRLQKIKTSFLTCSCNNGIQKHKMCIFCDFIKQFLLRNISNRSEMQNQVELIFVCNGFCSSQEVWNKAIKCVWMLSLRGDFRI